MTGHPGERLAWFAFVATALANVAANLLRNVWANLIIFCGHFPAGVHHFTPEDVEGETLGRWYVRQLLGSCNIGGGALFHVLSGNLSHQIEHHLFPDLPAIRYADMAERVRETCARYGQNYNTGSFWTQFTTVVARIVRYSFPTWSAAEPAVAG
jgi:linoleoyl-CoA desaturase